MSEYLGYLNLCTQYYDLDKPQPPADELEFYLGLAREANGRVLEPMCGSGRFLIPLLRHGFEVDGIDASEHMLGACRKKLAEAGLHSELYLCILHEFQIRERYDLAFIASRSIGLLTDEAELKLSLGAIHRALKSGGKFVLSFDLTRSDAVGSYQAGGDFVRRPDGALIVYNWQNIPERRICRTVARYDLVVNGVVQTTEIEVGAYRGFTTDEVANLLAEAGFRSPAFRKYCRQDAPDESDETLTVVCAKR